MLMTADMAMYKYHDARTKYVHEIVILFFPNIYYNAGVINLVTFSPIRLAGPRTTRVFDTVVQAVLVYRSTRENGSSTGRAGLVMNGPASGGGREKGPTVNRRNSRFSGV